MPITPANPQQFKQALSLLQSNKLPVNDLHSGSQLFVLEEKGCITGTIAAEYNFNDALLRSLSVDGSQRGKGSGKNLVAFLEDYLAKQGIGSIYLLTTTAAPFFEKLGYKVIDRTEVPEFIRSTTEFSSVCPSSATVMKKTLS